MQPVHGTLWEPWEALLYLEYCGVLDELSDPRSTLFVMETLPFLSPSQRRQDTGGPSELFWRKGGSRGRAEAQETAGNTADGVQRKPEVTTKKSFWSQISLAHASEFTIWVWAHAGERAKMRSSNLSVTLGHELDDKEILGARSPNSQNR